VTPSTENFKPGSLTTDTRAVRRRADGLVDQDANYGTRQADRGAVELLFDGGQGTMLTLHLGTSLHHDTLPDTDCQVPVPYHNRDTLVRTNRSYIYQALDSPPIPS
jgi:hypothetical protein